MHMTNETGHSLGTEIRDDAACDFVPVVCDGGTGVILIESLFLFCVFVYLVICGVMRRRKNQSVQYCVAALRVSAIGYLVVVLWTCLSRMDQGILQYVSHHGVSGYSESWLFSMCFAVSMLKIPLPVVAFGLIAAECLALPRRNNENQPQPGQSD